MSGTGAGPDPADRAANRPAAAAQPNDAESAEGSVMSCIASTLPSASHPRTFQYRALPRCPSPSGCRLPAPGMNAVPFASQLRASTHRPSPSGPGAFTRCFSPSGWHPPALARYLRTFVLRFRAPALRLPAVVRCHRACGLVLSGTRLLPFGAHAALSGSVLGAAGAAGAAGAVVRPLWLVQGASVYRPGVHPLLATVVPLHPVGMLSPARSRACGVGVALWCRACLTVRAHCAL